MKRGAEAHSLVVSARARPGGMPARSDTNRNATLAAASPTKEPFDAGAIEAELVKLERDWGAAAKNKDNARRSDARSPMTLRLFIPTARRRRRLTRCALVEIGSDHCRIVGVFGSEGDRDEC